MIRARQWAFAVAVVTLLLHASPAYAGDYWAKSYRYLFLDALIVTSPLTGLLALITAANPRWKTRPKDWRTSDILPYFAHKWLVRHALTIAALTASSVLGLFTLGMHLLNFV